MHRWTRLLAIAGWLAAAPALAAPPCDDDKAIWANDGPGGVRHIIYRVDGEAIDDVSAFGYLFFEEWRNGKLAWRTGARVDCSLGFSTCRLSVPISRRDENDDNATEESADDDSGDDQYVDPATDTIIEVIDENGDGLNDWVVLAGLGQDLHYSGGAWVEWYNGFQPEEYERATAPNLYKYAGCRTARVLPEKSSLFVKPGVCDYYRKTGSLKPVEDFKPDPGKIVWMRGNEIGGGDLKCDIGSLNEDGTISASCVEGAGKTSEPTTFRFAYGWDHVVLDTGDRLDLCEK